MTWMQPSGLAVFDTIPMDLLVLFSYYYYYFFFCQTLCNLSAISITWFAALVGFAGT